MLDIVFGDILDVIDPIGHPHLARGWSIVSVIMAIAKGMWVAATGPVAPIPSIMIIIGMSGVMVVVVARWVSQRSIVPVHNLKKQENTLQTKISTRLSHFNAK